MKGKVIKVYFRPEEEDLYQRLLWATKKTKKGRNWGISEYIKLLLRFHFGLPPLERKTEQS